MNYNEYPGIGPIQPTQSLDVPDHIKEVAAEMMKNQAAHLKKKLADEANIMGYVGKPKVSIPPHSKEDIAAGKLNVDVAIPAFEAGVPYVPYIPMHITPCSKRIGREVALGDPSERSKDKPPIYTCAICEKLAYGKWSGDPSLPALDVFPVLPSVWIGFSSPTHHGDTCSEECYDKMAAMKVGPSIDISDFSLKKDILSSYAVKVVDPEFHAVINSGDLIT